MERIDSMLVFDNQPRPSRAVPWKPRMQHGFDINASWFKPLLALCQPKEATTHQSDLNNRINSFLRAEETANRWAGIAGASALAVLRAHAAIACRRGELTYSASHRELAERSGVALPTVKKANLRLQRMGLLELLRRGWIRKGKRMGSSWRLTLVKSDSDAQSHSGLNEGASRVASIVCSHDASRWGGGLGKGMVGLLVALESGPASVSNLAVRLGRHRVSVSRQLARLVSVGLAARSAGKRGRYRLAVEPDALQEKLDEVATRLGVAGKGERVKAVFREQRRIYDLMRVGKTITPARNADVAKRPLRDGTQNERRSRAATTKRRGIAPRMRYRILEMARFRCVACGSSSNDGVTLHIDHIIPISRGGSSDESNLQVLCQPCNLGKSDMMPREMPPRLGEAEA